MGLLVNTNVAVAPTLNSAVWGAAGGFLALWMIRSGHQAITLRQDGLGLGDCKMMAAIGAWLGWGALRGLSAISVDRPGPN